MSILGAYSIQAFVLHVVVVFFKVYEQLDSVIIIISIIGAFWEIFTTESEKTVGTKKCLGLISEIGLLIAVFPELYQGVIEMLTKASYMAWYYYIGLALICYICLMAKDSVKNNLIGLILLGTGMIFLFERIHELLFGVLLVVFYHILALTGIYILRVFSGQNQENVVNSSVLLSYGYCYMASLMVMAFIKWHYVQALLLLGIGIVILLLQKIGIAEITGTVYGNICFGLVPWLLLEMTLFLSGKLRVPLSSTIAFTIIFWIVASVGLSWKDSGKIQSIVLEKANAETILKGLAYCAYCLTMLTLFIK